VCSFESCVLDTDSYRDGKRRQFNESLKSPDINLRLSKTALEQLQEETLKTTAAIEHVTVNETQASWRCVMLFKRLSETVPIQFGFLALVNDLFNKLK